MTIDEKRPSHQVARQIHVLLATIGLHFLVMLEIVIMSTPFAAYYYAAYGPVLEFLNGSPYLFWLNEFFITHLSDPDSILLHVIRNVGKVLAFGGLVLFTIHAGYLYWMKLVKKAIATRMLYAYVRHPQYACWIAAGLGLAILWPRFINLYLWFGMTFAYFSLARYEERTMERKHGGAYSTYLAGKGMFLPNLRLRGLPFVLPRYKTARRRYAVPVLLALLTISAFGCREHSVSKLDVRFPSSTPDAVVVAMNPPREVDIDALSEDAGRFVSSSGQNDTAPNLMILIWGRSRFRHFLIDTGFNSEYVKKSDFPSASVYLITASARNPRLSADAGEILDRTAALGFWVRRRIESVYYMSPEANGHSWEQVPVMQGALRPHASVPVL